MSPHQRPSVMIRRLLTVAAFSTLVTVAAPVTHVLACSCIQFTPGQALATADAAWVGVVTGIDNPQDPQAELGNDPIRYTFAVESVLKGQVGATVDVRSSPSSASCGQEFALAQRWRVFTFADENLQLQTGLCSGNELLAEGVAPTPRPTGPPTALLVGIGGIAVVAGISGWAFTRRTRSSS
jgi:hypothetical protein